MFVTETKPLERIRPFYLSDKMILWDTCQKITRSRDLSRFLHTHVHSNISHSCWEVETNVNSQVACERKELYTSDCYYNAMELYSGLSEGNRPAQKTFTEWNKLHNSNKHPMIPLTQATWRNQIHSDWNGLSLTWEDLDSPRRQTSAYTHEGPFRLLLASAHACEGLFWSG